MRALGGRHLKPCHRRNQRSVLATLDYLNRSKLVSEKTLQRQLAYLHLKRRLLDDIISTPANKKYFVKDENLVSRQIRQLQQVRRKGRDVPIAIHFEFTRSLEVFSTSFDRWSNRR